MEHEGYGLLACSNYATWLALCFKNPNITIEFIDKHIDTLKYNNFWGAMTMNNNITVQHIIDRMHDIRYKWAWELVLEKEDVTLNYIEEYVLKDAGLEEYIIWDVCSCECVTLDFVKKHASIINVIFFILCNPKVGIDTLEKYFRTEQIILGKDMDCVSKNPNLTADFIEKHAHLSWNAAILSSNTFGLRV
jgi:hypothetical protein